MIPTRELRFPSTLPNLQGERLRLRALREADIPGWFARATDAESAELAGDPIPASIEQGRAWLEHHRERLRLKQGLRWAVVPRGAVEGVGTVGLAIVSAAERRAEIGVVIGRAHWNQGLASEAIRLVADHALQVIGLAEIQAEVLERNTASRKVLTRCGFELVAQGPLDDGEAGCFYRLLANGG